MEFTISKTSLQKELGLVQGTVEKKNTIPALSNILIESVGEGTIRVTGTDLDVTLRCETEAEIKSPGSMCVGVAALRTRTGWIGLRPRVSHWMPSAAGATSREPMPAATG